MLRIILLLLFICFALPASAQEKAEGTAQEKSESKFKIEYVDANLSKLHDAVFFGQNDLVEFYLKNGVDVNILAGNNTTPLHMAAFKGHLETVKLLLKYGADPTIKNIMGLTAGKIAKSRGYPEIATLLGETEK